MLKLFKSKKVLDKKSEVIQKISNTKPKQVINSKVIQEDLLKEFKAILDKANSSNEQSKLTELKNQLETFKINNKKIYDKIKTLNSLGLSNTPSNQKILKELRQKEKETNSRISNTYNRIREQEEIVGMVNKCKIKFPGYKFIDHRTMNTIMEKYNLILGESSMYSKEIPDENLEIINKFSDHIEETKKILSLECYRGSTTYRFRTKSIPKSEPIMSDNVDGYELHQRYMLSDRYFGGVGYIDHNNDRIVAEEFIISNFKIIAPESHFEVPRFKEGNVDVSLVKLNPDTRRLEYNVTELNERMAELNPVLDPIAAFEVHRGFVIMTAWDEEADIPEIQNEILN